MSRRSWVHPAIPPNYAASCSRARAALVIVVSWGKIEEPRAITISEGASKAQDRFLPSFWTMASYLREPQELALLRGQEVRKWLLTPLLHHRSSVRTRTSTSPAGGYWPPSLTGWSSVAYTP